MVQAQDARGSGSTTESIIEGLGKGRQLRADASRALSLLLGVPAGREGLSRFFQPGFPGVRSFALEARAEPDQTVDFTVVSIARDGAPVAVARRSLLAGREGALEIHHEHDEVEPAYRSRNLVVDNLRRELALLESVRTGPGSRITIDAEGAGRFLAAMNGAVFADETDEGPSTRSVRARDPTSDRARMIEAGAAFVERLGHKHALAAADVARAVSAIRAATLPWAVARVALLGLPTDLAATDGGLAGNVGRMFLSSEEAPDYRGALYLAGDEDARAVGEAFRQYQHRRAENRLAEETVEAQLALATTTRAVRLKGLETLAQIGASWVMPEVRALVDDPDRRVATAARHALKIMTFGDLSERILAYAETSSHPARLRAFAYRVLAEFYPSTLADKHAMLRVHPDARIQRAVVPVIAEALEPTDLASMLAANPWNESPVPRPGLLELRIELIERLALAPDPRTLPPLLAAVVADPPPPAAEMAAVTRALVAYPDPRARVALTLAAQRLDRPMVP
jgi:hypothetical protein